MCLKIKLDVEKHDVEEKSVLETGIGRKSASHLTCNTHSNTFLVASTVIFLQMLVSLTYFFSENPENNDFLQQCLKEKA